jgi:3-hydroxyisobutyrate dehydrogenase
VIAVMDGLVMGGGVGLSAHAAHRVVTERSAVAMPEVGIGFFPDVGASFLLARAPGSCRHHLALTGDRIGAADAIYCGLADISYSPPDFRDSRRSPIAADRRMRARLAKYPSRRRRAWPRRGLDRCAATRATGRRHCRPALRGCNADAARAALATMRKASPTSLKVTLRNLRALYHSNELSRASSRTTVSRWRALPDMISSKASARPSSTRTAIRRGARTSLRMSRTDIVDRHFKSVGALELSFRTERGLRTCRTSDLSVSATWAADGRQSGQGGRARRGFDVVPASREASRKTACRSSPTPRAPSTTPIVITMLPAGEHVCRSGTTSCRCAARHAVHRLLDHRCGERAQSARARGRRYGIATLDAPVSGGVGGAKAATLTFMVGGSQHAFARGKPVLERMGKRIVHCGEAGNGQVAKMCNNMILGVSMIAVSEAFVLGEKLGLSHQAMFDVASASSGQCWSLTSYCPVPGPVPASPANNGYKAGFAAALMLKDLKARQSRRGIGQGRYGARRARREIYEAQEGHSGADFSAIIKLVRELS